MELVMPFVVCRTEGGCFDDDAYVNGFEAGRLDALLQHQRPPVHEDTVHSDNMPQVDLIAMSRGYTLSVEGEDDGWTHLTFTRGDDDGG